MAVAVIVALLAAVGLGVLLAGDGDERLATPTPAPSASLSSTPAPSDEPVPSASVSGPATDAPDDLETTYLSPERAGQVEQPGWSIDASYVAAPGPVFDPCGDGAIPRRDVLAASAERQMSSRREAGGSMLTQEVFRYASDADASAAYEDYAATADRCSESRQPDTQFEGGGEIYQEVAAQDQSDESSRLLLRRIPCGGATGGSGSPEEAGCPRVFASYVMVARSGDVVTAALYAQGADGDPEQQARAIFVAVADQLADAVRG